jgi:hypothetical protein
MDRDGEQVMNGTIRIMSCQLPEIFDVSRQAPDCELGLEPSYHVLLAMRVLAIDRLFLDVMARRSAITWAE